MKYALFLKDKNSPRNGNRFFACCQFSQYSDNADYFESSDLNTIYKYIEHCNDKSSHDYATTETIEIREIFE